MRVYDYDFTYLVAGLVLVSAEKSETRRLETKIKIKTRQFETKTKTKTKQAGLETGLETKTSLETYNTANGYQFIHQWATLRAECETVVLWRYMDPKEEQQYFC